MHTTVQEHFGNADTAGTEHVCAEHAVWTFPETPQYWPATPDDNVFSGRSMLPGTLIDAVKLVPDYRSECWVPSTAPVMSHTMPPLHEVPAECWVPATMPVAMPPVMPTVMPRTMPATMPATMPGPIPALSEVPTEHWVSAKMPAKMPATMPSAMPAAMPALSEVPAECWVPATMPTPPMQMAAAPSFQLTELSVIMQPDALPPPPHLEPAEDIVRSSSQTHVLSLVQALEESSYLNVDQGPSHDDLCDSGDKKRRHQGKFTQQFRRRGRNRAAAGGA